MLTVDMWKIDSRMKVPRLVTVKGRRGEREKRKKRWQKREEAKERSKREGNSKYSLQSEVCLFRIGWKEALDSNGRSSGRMRRE